MSDDQAATIAPLTPLTGEDRAEARRARQDRRVFAATSSPFVRAMRQAQAAYLEMRASGVDRDDAIAGLELVLRDVWPKATTKFPSRCDSCEDVGWEPRRCRLYARCGRSGCSEKGDGWAHDYVVPCACPKGDRFRPKTATPTSELERVGRVQKPKRGFSKVGS